jgi:hypothetical protein
MEEQSEIGVEVTPASSPTSNDDSTATPKKDVEAGLVKKNNLSSSWKTYPKNSKGTMASLYIFDILCRFASCFLCRIFYKDWFWHRSILFFIQVLSGTRF